MAQILCFGDSITQGYTDSQGGWTQRLRKYLEGKYVDTYPGRITVPAHDVFNLGISGDTSSGLLRRLEQEARPRLIGDHAIVVIAIGTNDSVFKVSTHKNESTKGKFRDNLERLVREAKLITSDLVLVGLLPCEESKMQPMPWSRTGRSYSNQRLRAFNEIVAAVGKINKLPVVNLFDKVSELGAADFLFDGLHLNAKGHQLIADEVAAHVEHCLRQAARSG